MTISSTTRQAGPYAGNGVTVAFPFTFKVFAAGELLVALTDADGVQTELVLTTNYSVALNADQNVSPGGTVTTVVAPATGESLVIVSDVASLQPTNLTNAGGFYPRVINDSLDRATILVQQLDNKLSRAPLAPIGEVAPAFPASTDDETLGGYLRRDPTTGDLIWEDVPESGDAANKPLDNTYTGARTALGASKFSVPAILRYHRMVGFQEWNPAMNSAVDDSVKLQAAIDEIALAGLNDLWIEPGVIGLANTILFGRGSETVRATHNNVMIRSWGQSFVRPAPGSPQGDISNARFKWIGATAAAEPDTAEPNNDLFMFRNLGGAGCGFENCQFDLDGKASWLDQISTFRSRLLNIGVRKMRYWGRRDRTFRAATIEGSAELLTCAETLMGSYVLDGAELYGSAPSPFPPAILIDLGYQADGEPQHGVTRNYFADGGYLFGLRNGTIAIRRGGTDDNEWWALPTLSSFTPGFGAAAFQWYADGAGGNFDKDHFHSLVNVRTEIQPGWFFPQHDYFSGGFDTGQQGRIVNIDTPPGGIDIGFNTANDTQEHVSYPAARTVSGHLVTPGSRPVISDAGPWKEKTARNKWLDSGGRLLTLGASFAGLTSSRYLNGMDYLSISGTANVTVSYEALDPVDFPDAAWASSFIRVTVNSVSPGAAILLGCVVPDVETFNGLASRIAVLGLRASVAGGVVGASLRQIFGSGGSPAADTYTVATHTHSLTTDWRCPTSTFRFETFSTAGMVRGTNNNDRLYAALILPSAVGVYDIALPDFGEGWAHDRPEALDLSLEAVRLASYLRVVGRGARIQFGSATIATLNLALSPPMLRTPAVSLLAGVNPSVVIAGDGTYTASGSAASVADAASDGITVNLTGFTGGTTFRGGSSLNSPLLLDARP